jgi:ElaB/YqjD/DUF883 family membrane-anchored ribosome-binding protein
MTTTKKTSKTTEERPEATPPERRSAYRQKREAQIAELAARLDVWEAKARQAKAEARVRYREELDELRGRIDTARMRMSLLKDAGEDAWDEVRAGADAAMKELRRAFRRASSKFD